MNTYRFSYASDNGWANGEGPSKYVGARATHSPESVGIDIFRTPGLLRSGQNLTQVSGISETLRCMRVVNIYDGSNNYESILGAGDGGGLFEVRNITGASITVSVLASISNLGGFIEEHKDNLYIAGASVIQRYGDIHAAAPTVDATYWQGMTQAIRGWNLEKPLYSWNGRLYCGDGNKLKSILGDESTGTSGVTELELDDDEIISQISGNADYLLFGTMCSAANSSDGKTRAWFYKWNGTDTSFTSRALFPEDKIVGITVFGTEVLVWGKDYLYQLDGSDFIVITSVDSASTSIDGFDHHGGRVWWKDSACIRAIGSPEPQLPKAKYRPISGTGVTYGSIKWGSPTRLFVADNNALYYTDTGNAVNVVWYSRMISESSEVAVNEVKVYLGDALASGDSFTIQLADQAGNIISLKDVTYADDGAISEYTLRNESFDNDPGLVTGWQILIKFVAGDPEIKEIIVHTQQVAQP